MCILGLVVDRDSGLGFRGFKGFRVLEDNLTNSTESPQGTWGLRFKETLSPKTSNLNHRPNSQLLRLTSSQ